MLVQHRITLILAGFLLASCSNGGKDSEGASTQSTLKPGMKESGLLLPTGDEKVDPAAAQADSDTARAKPGSRDPFQASFDAGVSLLPSEELTRLPASKLQLSAAYGLAATKTETVVDTDTSTATTPGTPTPTNSEVDTSTAVVVDDGGPGAPDPKQCDAKQACNDVCATATASAYAFAFAHASATACAWAEAWACAFTFNPFQNVCAWSRSEACVTSFSSAFAFGFATDTETVCANQCK